MKAIPALLLIIVVGGCASSSLRRPNTEGTLMPAADFTKVLDHDYYLVVSDTVDIALKEKIDGIRYVHSGDPGLQNLEVVGGTEQIQDVQRAVTAGFTCPVRGRIILQAIAGRNGVVRAPHILKGIHEDCDSKAIEIARNIQFQTARLNGEPISVLFSVPIRFE